MENKELKMIKYTKGLHSYGLYPVLTLLKEYEISERYEECAIILEAIFQKFPEKDLPTKIEDFSEQKYREMFDRFGLKADVALKNNNFYVEEIKKL